MIAASVIYYYSTSPKMSDRGLALRRVRLDVDKPNEEEEHASVSRAEETSAVFLLSF